MSNVLSAKHNLFVDYVTVACVAWAMSNVRLASSLVKQIANISFHTLCRNMWLRYVTILLCILFILIIVKILYYLILLFSVAQSDIIHGSYSSLPEGTEKQGLPLIIQNSVSACFTPGFCFFLLIQKPKVPSHFLCSIN